VKIAGSVSGPEGNVLSGFGTPKLTEDIYVPAGQKAMVTVEIGPFSDQENAKAGEDADAYAARSFPTLRGFELYDEKDRYVIVFPGGWTNK
jgi:hypothetical protein